MHVEKIGSATLYLGDCLKILPELHDLRCVVTDPPYGISYEPYQPKHGGVVHEKIANDEKPFTDFLQLLNGCESLHLFTRYDVLNTWKVEIEKIGFSTDLLVWDKIMHGMGNFNKYAPTHELILHCIKKAKRLQCGRPQNVLRFLREQNQEFHPTQKPIALMKKIIMHQPYDHIVDPCMGSGSTGVAAVSDARSFCGIEIDQKHFHSACRRIRAEANQPQLWAVPAKTEQPMAFAQQENVATS